MLRVKKQVNLLLTLVLFSTLVLFPNNTSAAQQEFDQLSCHVDRGVDIVFVMDDSGSMGWNDPTYIRVEAANNLVNAMHDYDRVSVIKVNSEASNLLSLTNNRQDIYHALNLLGASGGTDLSEGMSAALEEFRTNSGNNHKVMIILSDGESINNEISVAHAQTAYEENITIYTIGLGTTENLDVDMLRSLATKTGGEYFHAANAPHLTSILDQVRLSIEDNREPKVHSDWTLTDDLYEAGNLVLHENVKLNLNGYNLEVEGELVLLSCAEVRAISGTITAGNVEQRAGSILNLNNSQLHVKQTFSQGGYLRVNGAYKSTSEPEVLVDGEYNQLIRGYLDLNGHAMQVKENFTQDGHVYLGGGKLDVLQDVTQRGYFDLQQGTLMIGGNLQLAGGPLLDDAFETNKSLNVNNGLLQVGSAASMEQTSKYGNVHQTSGQLYVNHGTVRIFGDYTIQDGWLTMTEGSMDTTSKEYGEDDGDYVHVHRDFSMESMRNHAKREYRHLGKPANDEAHLTDGVLRVDGNFYQKGDRQFHASYSDRSQNYTEDYSRNNFVAEGRHKVLLTGKGNIDVSSSHFQFNILELAGRLGDYTRTGQVKWNQLIENDQSTKTALKSLTINDIPVRNFQPNTLNYFNHVVPQNSLAGPLRMLKVDAVAEDHRNATVMVTGNQIGRDGTAQVQVLVTAADGKAQAVYTVNVSVGTAANADAVTSLELDRETYVFMEESTNRFSPSNLTIGYTIHPNTADNQQVEWTSTDPSVATVNNSGIVTPVSIGKTSIVAKTIDGGFSQSVSIEVKPQHELLAGVKTLADFVADNERYDQIMSLYDPARIGIVVPGQYIKSVQLSSSGAFAVGTIETDTSVDRVEVRVGGRTLAVPEVDPNKYVFSRSGLSPGTYIEVIAYNAAGDELERISTSYPVAYRPITIVNHGFYSVRELMQNPSLFNLILDYYSLDELKFTV